MWLKVLIQLVIVLTAYFFIGATMYFLFCAEFLRAFSCFLAFGICALMLDTKKGKRGL